MSSINTLNPHAKQAQKNQALAINISAARSLQNIIKSNLGPRGTLKVSIIILEYKLDICQ